MSDDPSTAWYLSQTSLFFRLCDGFPVFEFSELHAAIHLAHKYQCPDVETRALSILKRFYTPCFDDYVHFDPSKASMTRPSRYDAVAAVNIARLTKTQSMLPYALYQVCTLEERMLDGYTRRDGYVEYLTPDDLKLCLSARRELAKQTAFYIQDVCEADPSDGCTHTAQCTSALIDIRDEVQVDVLGGCDIFDSYVGVVADIAKDFDLCKACKKQALQREEAERRKVWRMLPGMFMMPNKECGFTDWDGPLQ